MNALVLNVLVLLGLSTSAGLFALLIAAISSRALRDEGAHRMLLRWFS